MEKKTGYDAVVFDMDGVIFDSERAVMHSLSGERRVISCMRTDGSLPDPESGYEFCRAVRPQ